MTGPSLDLDALREKAEKGSGIAGYYNVLEPAELLALVEYIEGSEGCLDISDFPTRDTFNQRRDRFAAARAALAGSPAEKEPTRATATTAATTFVMRERSRRQKAAA